MNSMTSISMPPWLEQTFAILLALLPGGLWCLWWLCAVDWKKLRPVLTIGAWLPVALLMLIVALVWSELEPRDCGCLGFVRIPNFWWQLGSVCTLVAIALFCGWLQSILSCRPSEIAFDAPGSGAEGSHGHGGHH